MNTKPKQTIAPPAKEQFPSVALTMRPEDLLEDTESDAVIEFIEQLTNEASGGRVKKEDSLSVEESDALMRTEGQLVAVAIQYEEAVRLRDLIEKHTDSFVSLVFEIMALYTQFEGKYLLDAAQLSQVQSMCAQVEHRVSASEVAAACKEQHRMNCSFET
eukprot:gene28150-34964_t